MKRTTLSLLFLLCLVSNAMAEEISITVKGTTDKASCEVIALLNGSNRDTKTISVTDGSFVYSDKVEKYTFLYFYDKKAKTRTLAIADSENVTLDMQDKKVFGSPLTEKLISIDAALDKHDSLRTQYRAQAFKEQNLLLRKELRQKAL